MPATAPRLADDFPEAARTGELLRGRGWRVAVAESCTGGLLGAALTAVPGSSDYVLGGVLAYANEVKTALLGVDPELLAVHGAVSEEVARAMAEGVRNALQADVAAAVTGVAGPAAESSSKPAGLVFVAVAGPGGSTRVVRLDEDLGREGNRAAAVRAALQLIAEMAG
ncbi:MAG TPA: CinA family protein [Candidatus Dormibacteraeota bacterium]|nr:CinA family protein [Candidatus Dormibacteraeota bacterium]